MINNQYNNLSIDEFKTDLEFLMRKAVHLSGEKAGHVIVLSIPDWGVTPYAAKKDSKKISSEIDAYNLICETAAKQFQTIFINITEDSRKAKKDHTLLASDHLHYSGKGYAVWAEKVAGVIARLANK